MRPQGNSRKTQTGVFVSAFRMIKSEPLFSGVDSSSGGGGWDKLAAFFSAGPINESFPPNLVKKGLSLDLGASPAVPKRP